MSFFRRPLTLKLQLAAVFGMLVILSSVALTWVLTGMLHDRARADAERSLTFIASNASNVLSAGLESGSSMIESLTQRASLWEEGLGSAEVQRMVEIISSTHAIGGWVGVADMAGRVQTATNGMLLGANVSERPWFQNGKNDLFVGDLHPAKLLASLMPATASGEPPRFLDYAAPIRRGDQTLGVMGVHVNWTWAEQIIETILPEEARALGIEVFVFDQHGEVIYAPHGDSQKLSASRMRMPTITPGSSIVKWPDGGEFLIGQARLRIKEKKNDLGWTIVVREPIERAFKLVEQETRKAVGIGLLIAVFSVILAGMAAHRFGADVRRMVRAVENVEAGVPGARIPPATSNAEMNTLAHSVDSMTRRLLAAKEDLEQQVKQRTQDLEIANAELSRQAKTDALTGLLNRHVFDPMLEHMVQEARRSHRALSVLMVDADHFKRINDVHGHLVGDQVLQMLAAILKSKVRASDIVGRLGGEEFGVLLPDTNEAGALKLAQSLVDCVAEQDHAVWGKLTISIGLTTCVDGMTSGQGLMGQADEALYAAKSGGRNRVHVFKRPS